MNQAIRYEKGQDQIVVLTVDMPGQSANTMNAVYREAMADCVARLVADKDNIAGVIITSAKKTFFAGGDLNELIKVDKTQAKAFYDRVLTLKGQLRTLSKKALAWGLPTLISSLRSPPAKKVFLAEVMITPAMSSLSATRRATHSAMASR